MLVLQNDRITLQGVGGVVLDESVVKHFANQDSLWEDIDKTLVSRTRQKDVFSPVELSVKEKISSGDPSIQILGAGICCAGAFRMLPKE